MTKKNLSNSFEVGYAVLAIVMSTVLTCVVVFDLFYFLDVFKTLAYCIVASFILLIILSNVASKILVNLLKSYE